MMPMASDYPARSPVYRRWETATSECADSLIAVGGETTQLACTLADLSPLSRVAVRGSGAVGALQEAGWPVPEKPNQVCASDSRLVARLGATEHWLLSTTPTDTLTVPEATATGVLYSVPCQDSHACFALRGDVRAEVMSKLCGVDMREAAFPVGSVAQTSVALISAIVLHTELYGAPGFCLLCDSSYADYLWSALLDAMSEFDGAVCGVPVA